MNNKNRKLEFINSQNIINMYANLPVRLLKQSVPEAAVALLITDLYPPVGWHQVCSRHARVHLQVNHKQ